MNDDGNILLSMCDAYVCHAVLKVRLSVVMMVEIHLFLEYFIEKCSYSQFLFPLALAAEEHDFFHLICRNRTQVLQLLFCFCDLPYGNLRLVV